MFIKCLLSDALVPTTSDVLKDVLAACKKAGVSEFKAQISGQGEEPVAIDLNALVKSSYR